MTTLLLPDNWLSPAVVRAVGYALLHSLWQGAVLAGLLAGTQALLRRRRPELRYGVAVAALAALTLAVGGTLAYYLATPAAVSAASSNPLAVPLTTQLPTATSTVALAGGLQAGLPYWLQGGLQALGPRCEPYLPLVVAAWLLGLLLMAARLVGGVVVASRLRRVGTRTLAAEWPRRLAALARRAGVCRPVALLESARVAGPLVLGHLRPVVLLPLGAVAGLPPALLEALLAHEVAHIARRDYLLNLALAVVETLFFYHPAVWLMAASLRVERENCCDDQAARLCGGDTLRVARALAALAELTATAPLPRLALAAAGPTGPGSLLARVRRLVQGQVRTPSRTETVLAALLTLLSVLGLGTSVVLAASPHRPAGWPTLPPVPPAWSHPVAADTLPRPAASAGVSAATPAIVAPAALASPATLPAAPASPPTATAPSAPSAPAAAPGEAADAAAERRLPRPASRRASQVVIEKDKKGRLVGLQVDGQPVPTGHEGKRGKKATNSVEVVELPAAPWPRAHASENSFKLSFSTDGIASDAQREALRSLQDELENEDFQEETRRDIKLQVKKLKAEIDQRHNEFQLELAGRPTRHGMSWNVESSARSNQRIVAEANARQAERNAQQAEANGREAERNAQRAAANAQQAEANGREAERNAQRAAANAQRAEANARRIELQARIAAAQAELQTLDGGAGSAVGRSRPLRQVYPPAASPAPLALPAPPAPPSTDRLRAELRRDGLIGVRDRNFSFELNDQGGRVNGQPLTATQEAKYRRLLRHPATKGKSSSSFSISVDEN